jgi:hypothetical protein
LNIHLLPFEWASTDIRIQKIFELEYPSFIIWVRLDTHLYLKDIRIQISIIIIWVRFDRHSYSKDIHVRISICYHLSEIQQTFIFERYSYFEYPTFIIWVRFDRHLYSKDIHIQISIIIIWMRFDRHLYSKDIRVWIYICYHLSEIRQTFIFERYSYLNIHLLSFEWDSTDICIRRIFVFKYPSL